MIAVMNDPIQEDWLKTQHWDLPITVAGLEAMGIDPKALVDLPCAKAMPDALRKEIIKVTPQPQKLGGTPLARLRGKQ